MRRSKVTAARFRPRKPTDHVAERSPTRALWRSEREMSVNRFVFCAVVTLYLLALGPRAYASALLAMAAYTALSLILLFRLLRTGSPSTARCVVAVFADMSVISADMLLGGSSLAAIYSIYLWVILGNGFRFGLRFLFLSTALAMSGFALVWWRSPFWSSQPALAAGLLLGLMTVPLYGAMLIRRLSTARLEAEEANRAKSMFLASVSHSVRTPLNTIIGGLSLLTGTSLDGEQRELTAKLRIGCDVLLLLLGSILDFTRIEAGRMPVRPQPVPIADILREVASLFRQQAEEKKLRLFVHVGEFVPASVVTDRRHVTEILVNLLGNALKFTERGEVVLSVSAERPVDGSCRLVIDVTDTGIGLSPDARERIFGSFTQADDTIIDRFGGTGLGLAIVRGLTGMLGGTVTVDSVPGRGSRFSVSLPCRHADAAAPETVDPTAAFPSGCIRHAPSRSSPGLERMLDEIGLSSREVYGHPDLQAELDRLAANAGGLLLLDLSSLDELDALLPILDRADPFGRIPRLVMLQKTAMWTSTLSRQATTIASGNPSREELAAAIRRCMPPAAPAAEGPVRAERALDILVADDNVTNQRLIEQTLIRAGHRVHVVQDGEEAVVALTERHFDLALFDVNMPIMNGIEAAKEYQFLALGSEPTPIAALTADATPDTARRCRDAGMVDCINKPIVPAELVRRIDILVRRGQDVPPRRGRADTSPPPIRTERTVADIRSHPGFRASAGLDPHTVHDLRALGGDAFVSSMVEAFRKDADALSRQISTAAAARDILSFRNGVHALRSAAANVGASEIQRLCGSCRDLSVEDLPGTGRRLAARIAAAAELIRENRIDGGGGGGGGGDPATATTPPLRPRQA